MYDLLFRKLIILDHPNPKGSKDNQFAPRGGVNKLIKTGVDPQFSDFIVS